MVKSEKEVKVKDENYSLEGEIAKVIEEEQKERETFYLNKVQLNHSKTENKRIVMGFESFSSRK